MSIESTHELAGRYGAAWAEHDLDAIVAMHTEDTVFHLHGISEPAVGTRCDAQGIRRHVRRIAGPRFESRRVYIGENELVTLERDHRQGALLSQNRLQPQPV